MYKDEYLFPNINDGRFFVSPILGCTGACSCCYLKINNFGFPRKNKLTKEELLTAPEEETEDTVEITDGEPKVSEAPQQTESLTLAVEDYNMIAVKSIPIGALSGAIIMIIGFAYLGIVHIFKKV